MILQVTVNIYSSLCTIPTNKWTLSTSRSPYVTLTFTFCILADLSNHKDRLPKVDFKKMQMTISLSNVVLERYSHTMLIYFFNTKLINININEDMELHQTLYWNPWNIHRSTSGRPSIRLVEWVSQDLPRLNPCHWMSCNVEHLSPWLMIFLAVVACRWYWSELHCHNFKEDRSPFWKWQTFLHQVTPISVEIDCWKIYCRIPVIT